MMKLIDLVELGNTRDGDRVEYSVFEVPYPEKEGVLLWGNELVGYFTEADIIFFSPVYSLDVFCELFELVRKKKEKRRIFFHTSNWGWNKIIRLLYKYIVELNYKVDEELAHFCSFLLGETYDISFEELGIKIDEEKVRSRGFYEYMLDFIVCSEGNKVFAFEFANFVLKGKKK